jgi:hypothetical protein
MILALVVAGCFVGFVISATTGVGGAPRARSCFRGR